MTKDPAFLFYPSDFLMGVMLMNNTDVGIYIKTLCLLHQHGGYLSQKKLETALGLLPVSVIEKLQKNENDELYSRRLIEESIKRNTYCDSRRKNIQKRYEKSTYEPTYVTTDVVHMENRNRNRNKDLNINNNGIINTDIDTVSNNIDIDKDKKKKVIHISTGLSTEKDFRVGPAFEEFWASYPKPIGQSMAFVNFKSTVKTKKDFEDLKSALKIYKESQDFKKGFIKNGDKWLEDWRGWLAMKQKSVKRYIPPEPDPPEPCDPKLAEENLKKLRAIVSGIKP